VNRILSKKERYLLPRRHRWKQLDGNVVQPWINPTNQAKLILQLNLVFRVLDTHLISRGVLGAHGNLSPVRLATGLILFNTMHLATNLLGAINGEIYHRKIPTFTENYSPLSHHKTVEKNSNNELKQGWASLMTCWTFDFPIAIKVFVSVGLQSLKGGGCIWGTIAICVNNSRKITRASPQVSSTLGGISMGHPLGR